MTPRQLQSNFFKQHPGAFSVLDLFDALPNTCFYAKDTQSRFVRVNQAFLTSHGVLSEEGILGRNDRDFHPPLLAEAYIAEDQRVMAGRKPIPGQLWLVFNHKKQPEWYISTKVPLFDPLGEVIGIAGAMYAIEQSEEQARYFGELLPATAYMEKHYGEPISMAAMAERTGLSSTHFNRRFQQLLRTTPTEYLRTVRIQAARQALSTTQTALIQIALDTGFTDQSHFTRCFHKSTGMTPRDYRMRFQK